eukprot:scaffold4912_cov284-Chaetoceros_neogracile.AAC.27
MIATMPVSEAHNHHAASTTPASPIRDGQCDCAGYQTKGIACSCSLDYASKIGKRAVERLFHKSIFFQDANIDANVELQNEAEAAKGAWKNMDANKVVQVASNHVDVGNLLGEGGFCLVHEAGIILPNHQKVEKDYCVKFLKPVILAERRKLARGIADLAIEAHFLATLNHPHILKIRGVAEGIELFQPTCPELTNQPGIAGGYFLILDKMHTTLDKKIEIEWKSATDKYNSFLYRTTHDLRGFKRKGARTERLEVALQLAQAMQYLHQHNVVYRDLKPDNIGFDDKDNLKLFDFGLAKELKPYKRHEDGTYHLTANTGSRRYMAPPFVGYSEMQHMNFVVQRGFRPKLESLKHWPDGLRAMISRCWDQDMNRRPSFRDVVGALLEIKTAHINED